MLWTRRTIGVSMLRTLEGWCRRHCRLILISSLTLAAGLHLTVMPTQSVPSIMRTQHFEVVNAKGAVVFSIRATEAGGRLEVQDGTGATVFSVGVNPNDPEQFGLWEQSRQEIASQRRDLERQRRDLHSLTKRLQELERQNQLSSRTLSGGNAVDQYQSALARQDREIDNLERQISRLSRQIDSLERRQ
jgi:hypothetical protein